MTRSNSMDGSIKTWPAEVRPIRSGLVGGALGGIAMGAIAAVVSLARGDTVWLPVNLIAATVLRELQSVTPEALNQFHPGWVAIGVAMHLITAAAIGLLFVLIQPTLPGPVWAWGLVLGVLLWLGALYAILPLVNPIMFELVDRPSFVAANVVYGLVLGLTISRFPTTANPPSHPLDFQKS